MRASTENIDGVVHAFRSLSALTASDEGARKLHRVRHSVRADKRPLRATLGVAVDSSR